ncbi:hypothetical protein TNIN_222311 [Trichonephila inaurata madagascariensis]|uniref:Uncharacterized protein n=1 Tax=Trichonephila inaurata madagascariensis TaxID=2747483 RepID=A0A8X6XGS1_9ARAC|nr:hypothetical protein TNIN_222311 [Trichonephila inaurata madagascariensis]
MNHDRELEMAVQKAVNIRFLNGPFVIHGKPDTRQNGKPPPQMSDSPPELPDSRQQLPECPQQLLLQQLP